MTKQECLNTLGLSSDASMDDIKKAYRKLANKHHPDKEGGDNELFAKISEAYRCLKKNDFGVDGRKHYYNNAAGHGREEDISSVFEEFVRRASRGNGTEYDFGGFEDLFRQTRSHMVKTYAIDLKTVYHGGDVETDLGRFRIPAGVHTNTIMSVFDTDVKFKLIADDKFKRVRDNSADLAVLATVSSINLITGVTATLHHLSGNTIEIDIPKGTEINKVLRVKGQGLPVFNKSGQYGDLYVKLDVYTPKNLGVMQTKKLKKMFNSKIEI